MDRFEMPHSGAKTLTATRSISDQRGYDVEAASYHEQRTQWIGPNKR